MAKEINGALVNLYLRSAAVGGAFKRAVCVTDSSSDLTSDVTTTRTNCGPKTAVSDPTFTLTVNAVQNADPTSTEVEYQQLKAWVKAKTLLDFNYRNDADLSNSVAEGEGIQHYGSGYITTLSNAASAEDGTLTYSITITGTGNIDDYANSVNS